jgi:hypothetical protein
MITGAHGIIYSTNADADRALLRDVLRLTNVDVGGGWLIFGLPPAEIAVHPSDANDRHELYLMCDDVEAFVASMQGHDVACSDIADMDWGRLTQITLSGGGKLGVYEPRHERPEPMRGDAKADRADAERKEAKKAAKAEKKRAKAEKEAAKAAAKAEKEAVKAAAKAEADAAKAAAKAEKHAAKAAAKAEKEAAKAAAKAEKEAAKGQESAANADSKEAKRAAKESRKAARAAAKRAEAADEPAHEEPSGADAG